MPKSVKALKRRRCSSDSSPTHKPATCKCITHGAAATQPGLSAHEQASGGSVRGAEPQLKDRSKSRESPASAGFFFGRPSERYKWSTDDVLYIRGSRLPSVNR